MPGRRRYVPSSHSGLIDRAPFLGRSRGRDGEAIAPRGHSGIGSLPGEKKYSHLLEGCGAGSVGRHGVL